MFQSLTRDSNHSNRGRILARARECGFNPSRGIAIIQTGLFTGSLRRDRFQSLTRDSNHSNASICIWPPMSCRFQSLTRDSNHSNQRESGGAPTRCEFQSLTRDSNHSNPAVATRSGESASFNPSRGIAIIQTQFAKHDLVYAMLFQSLTRDSNHSNTVAAQNLRAVIRRFNPSRGIAIIQTGRAPACRAGRSVSIPHAG